MACVALRDPYDLAALPENVYGLAAYEYNIESLDTVAQAFTGAFVPAGQSPGTPGRRATMTQTTYVCGWDGGGTKTRCSA